MQILKTITLFYCAVLVIILVTVGLASDNQVDTAPGLLLIPVAVYYLFAFANQLTGFLNFVTVPIILQLKRLLHIYTLLIVILLLIANIAGSASIMQASLTLALLPLLIAFADIFSKKGATHFQLRNLIALHHLFKKDAVISPEQSESAETTNPDETITAQPADIDSPELIDENEAQVEDPSLANTDLSSEEAVIEDTTKPETQPSSEIESASESDDAVEQDMIETDHIQEAEIVSTDLTETNTITDNIKDRQRRQFLKILGGGGMSLIVMMFLMPNRAQAAFFGSVPGPGVVAIKDSSGNKIDPAEKKPTDGYTISEIDDDSSPSYYGFIQKDGLWYIARENADGSYRYASGNSNFSNNWSIRATLTYDYFDSVF